MVRDMEKHLCNRSTAVTRRLSKALGGQGVKNGGRGGRRVPPDAQDVACRSFPARGKLACRVRTALAA
jgi:hypothetical protein